LTTPGPNAIKLFTTVIYEYSYEARVFVPGNLFQPNLVFVRMDGAYPMKNLSGAILYGRLLTLQTNIRLAGKTRQGETL
jgi:hypothetical protein